MFNSKSAVIALAALAAAPATAATLYTDADGTFTNIVSVSPGVYGAEIREGRPGARTWELGVGTQTSNGGTFNQGEIEWADFDADDNKASFSMSWNAGVVSTSIGDTTVSYDANWQFGLVQVEACRLVSYVPQLLL